MYAIIFTARKGIWIVTDEFIYIQTDVVPLHSQTAHIPLSDTDEVGITDHNIHSPYVSSQINTV